MRPIGRICLLATVVVACVAPAAAAHRPRAVDGSPEIAPATRLAGVPGGELLGDWYVQNLSLPASAAPFAGTADLCLSLGHNAKVLSPSGGLLTPQGMTCTVRQNQRVLLVTASADCSSAEAAPFFGATEAEQRACAIGVLTSSPEIVTITAINVSVDGQPAVDIHVPLFFAVSPQRRVVFPENPVFGATPGPATFVAAGWIAEIRGMERGQHVLRSQTVTTAGPFPEFIVNFNVVGGNRHPSH